MQQSTEISEKYRDEAQKAYFEAFDEMESAVQQFRDTGLESSMPMLHPASLTVYASNHGVEAAADLVQSSLESDDLLEEGPISDVMDETGEGYEDQLGDMGNLPAGEIINETMRGREQTDEGAVDEYLNAASDMLTAQRELRALEY